MQFLIATTFAVILLVGVASSCPSVRRYTQAYHGVIVDCSNQRLWCIPKDIRNNTINFDLSFNQIRAIKSDTVKGLPKLIRLNLKSNKISVIEDNALHSPSLQYIDLSFNQITAIKSDTLKGLPKLSWLNLKSNKISVIEDNALHSPSLQYINLDLNKILSIKSDTFKDMPSLRNIFLRDNKISVIEENAFNNLPHLRFLILYHNKITSIKSSIFNNLPRLIGINMKKNKNISFVSDKAFVNLPQLKRLRFNMYCGCNSNIPFWTWLKVSQKFSLSIRCYDYNGLYLENIQPSNFYKCYEAPSTPFSTTTNTKKSTTTTPTSRTTASPTSRKTAIPTSRTTSRTTSRATASPTSRTIRIRVTRKKLDAPIFASRVVIGRAIGAGFVAGGILLLCVIWRLWRWSNNKEYKLTTGQD